MLPFSPRVWVADRCGVSKVRLGPGGCVLVQTQEVVKMWEVLFIMVNVSMGGWLMWCVYQLCRLWSSRRIRQQVLQVQTEPRVKLGLVVRVRKLHRQLEQLAEVGAVGEIGKALSPWQQEPQLQVQFQEGKHFWLWEAEDEPLPNWLESASDLEVARFQLQKQLAETQRVQQDLEEAQKHLKTQQEEASNLAQRLSLARHNQEQAEEQVKHLENQLKDERNQVAQWTAKAKEENAAYLAVKETLRKQDVYINQCIECLGPCYRPDQGLVSSLTEVLSERQTTQQILGLSPESTVSLGETVRRLVAAHADVSKSQSQDQAELKSLREQVKTWERNRAAQRVQTREALEKTLGAVERLKKVQATLQESSEAETKPREAQPQALGDTVKFKGRVFPFVYAEASNPKATWWNCEDGINRWGILLPRQQAVWFDHENQKWRRKDTGDEVKPGQVIDGPHGGEYIEVEP